MSYIHSENQAQKFANDALERIKEYELLPTPENYELWFVYFSGSEQELNAAVNTLTDKKGGRLTNDECYDLFQAFLSGQREGRSVRKAGDQMQKTILDVNNAVANVHKEAQYYTNNLNSVKVGLSDKNKSPEEIEMLVSGAVVSTGKMIESNNDLERMLADSNKVILNMRKDLEVARKEAMTDSLTGLANRKAFDQEIARLIEMANSSESPFIFCLILVDIDHFKSFNDKFGHQVGDQVLKLVARSFTESVKGRDLAVRYGGEEFAILLPETDIQGGMRVAELLRREVESKDVVNRTTGKRIAKITISGGVSQYEKGESISALIDRVDNALYEAKNAGRNRILSSEK